MAKCQTYGKIADRESKVCRNCGRPNPTKMRKGEVVWATVGVVILALYISGQDKAGHSESASLPPPVAPMKTVSDQTPAPSGPPLGAQETSISNQLTLGDSAKPATKGAKVQMPQSAEDSDSDYPYAAHLFDERGKVVIQSRPSVFYKNTDTLPSGSTVHAASKVGKWISVRLENGQVGFVRLRQLRFD